jgi:site-specific DNA-methyltransferase (adenine-specific)
MPLREEVLLGDCLNVLGNVADESIDLCYADPPFFTQKVHSLRPRGQDVAYSFSDAWETIEAYKKFLFERLMVCASKLKPTGSMFVHCDSTASHHIRYVLDAVLGAGNFRSEIVWSYRRWSNSQKSPLPSHQTIFFYSKSGDYKYFTMFEDYSPSTNVDQILQRRCKDSMGRSCYELDPESNPVLDGAKRGVPMGDVWDIPLLNPKAKERVGYPTQKPVVLLERIVRLVTEDGDTVLDPFCGSGSTLVAAKLLGRNSIGIDINPDAAELARSRLIRPHRTTSVVLDRGRDSFVESDPALLAVLSGLKHVPVQRNRGIDAIVPTRSGGDPVLVRIQRGGESLDSAVRALSRAGEKKRSAVLVLVVTDNSDISPVSACIAEVHLVRSTSASIHSLLEHLGVSSEEPSSTEVSE